MHSHRGCAVIVNLRIYRMEKADAVRERGAALQIGIDRLAAEVDVSRIVPDVEHRIIFGDVARHIERESVESLHALHRDILRVF